MRILNRHAGSRLIQVALLLLFVVIQQALMVTDARAQRAFTQRFNTNVNGDIRLIGNTVKTCDPAGAVGAATCNAAKSASAANNDNGSYSLIDVSVDGAGYTNSSTADLVLPVGSKVLFAGLYWGARSASVARGQVLFRTPASGGYSLVNASVIDSGVAGSASNQYQAFVDVTAQVAAAGNGTYGVANIQANNGNDGSGFWGGWSMVIAYQNASDALKNLAIYDGYQIVTAGGSITVTPSGFLTPLSGTVNARVGAVVYDGDPGPGAFALSETVTINGTVLSNAVNPSNDVFNSTVSDLGSLVTARNPFDRNTFGLDVDRYSVPAGVIANGATSATVTMTSAAGGETYYPQVLTTAIDLYVPIITPNVTKTVADLNGGALQPGDSMRWTISLSNTGIDTGTNVILKDPIPANTTFVPGSLVIISGANNGAKTDASSDDQAEFSNVPATCAPVASPCVIFRLGTGANSASGGSIAFNEATSLRFDTSVNAGVTSGTMISNSATISYSGQTLGSTFSTTSAAASMTVQAPPLISKSFSANPIAVNGTSVLTIVVSNPASSPTTLSGVTFTDTYPANLVNTAAPSPAVTCSPGATAGSLTGGAASGNTIGMSPGATLPPGASCTITVNVTSAVAGNYTNTTGAVASTNGGTGSTATATLGVGKPAISKAFSGTKTILSGSTSTVAFTLTNPTALALTGVAFSDPLTNMQVAAAPAVTNTCGGAVTAVAGSASISLAGAALAASPGAGSTCTITVNVTSTTTGVQPNTTTGVTSNETGAAGPPSNTDSLTVIGAPVAAKSFSPTSIQTTGANAGAASILTITITNPNASLTMTGVSFTDTYPANLLNATPSNATLSCTIGSSATLTGGTAAGNTIGMVGGSLAPGAVCSISVRVSSNTTGNYNNSTGSITSTNAGTGAAATATLNVSNLTPPTVAKSFTQANIVAGGTSVLTITLTNPQATPITGATFTDAFPSGVFNTAAPAGATTCAGGTVTAAPNGSSVQLAGGTIPASGNCTVTVNVTSSSVGAKLNTIAAGTVTTANAAVNTAAVSATLNVFTPPTIVKSFAPTAIGTDAADFSVMTLAITNPGANPANLTGISVLDTFPANLIVHTTPNSSTSGCGAATWQGRTGAGAFGAFASGNTAAQVTGLTLAPGATCTVTVQVRSNVAGNYTNTTGAVAATGPVALTGNTASALLSVGRPGISKAFATSPILPGASSVMTITLTNGTSVAMTAAAFTDTYPTSMTNAAAPAAATTCGGAVTAAANGPSVALSGGTIPANGTCTVTVTVIATATSVNTIAAAALTTSAGTNATAATATLTVTPPLTVVKSFSPSSIAANGTSVLTITLTNPNNFNVTTVGFTDNYPNSPAQLRNTAAPAGATTCAAGTVTAAANGTSLQFANGTVPANSSCTITVNVNVPTGTPGDYINSTGVVTTANSGSSPAVSATLTVQQPPSITKLMSLISDPVNGTINPRSIPGAIVEYTILITNNTVALTTDTVVITDVLNTNLALCVGAACGAGSPAVTFANGVTSSGLTYTPASDLTYSNRTTPAAFTYTPVAAANGCDANVSTIRANPKGAMANGVGVSPPPSFSLRFRACVR